jgi:hypothetical protein
MEYAGRITQRRVWAVSAALLLSFILCWKASAQTQALPETPTETPPEVSVATPSAEIDMSQGAMRVTPGRDPAPRLRSLFFSAEEIVAIRAAIASYKRRAANLGEEITEDEMLKLPGFQEAPSSRFFTYPQFFLESLVYHSPKDWVIWLNSQKITHASANITTDIRVLAIDENQVKLEWHPAVMERIMDVWQKNPTEGITVDSANGTVTFSLHTNQTFSSYVMRVLEGKVMPVTIDTDQLPLKETVVPEEAADSGIIPAAKASEREGLGGLIDAYQQLEERKP